MREAAGASHWTCTDMRRSFGQTSEGESVHFWSREKDEEAIALGTTLEQSFAIGPEAGGVEKGGGRVQMGKNKQGWTCMEVSDWADMHAKQSIKQSHTHIQRSNRHRQTKQTHIQQFKNNLAFLFFAIQLYNFSGAALDGLIRLRESTS